MNNKIRSVFIVLILSCVFYNHALGMAALTDKEMADVLGQQGVAINFEFRMNTNSSGNPLTASAGLPNCANSNFVESTCRFAIRFNNQNEWMLFRGVHASLKINQLAIDSGRLSLGGSDVSTFDATRFEDSNGDCLLEAGCTNGNVQSLQGLILSYKGRDLSILSYDPITRKTNGYRDIFQFGLSIKEVRLVAGESGFLDTATGGSFFGLSISDTQNDMLVHTDAASPRARAFMSGEVFVYGF